MSLLWLDGTGRGIFGRDADGNPVSLVAPGPGGSPGPETPAAAAWRQAGWGRGLDALLVRWRELQAAGEINRRRVESAMRRAESIRELVNIALETGSAAPLVEAVEQAEAGGVAIPASLAAGVVAINRLQTNVLDAAETLVSPLEKVTNRLITAGKWGLGIYGGLKLLEVLSRRK